MRVMRKLDLSISATACALCVVAAALWGLGPRTTAVGVGGIVAVANWVVLRSLLGGMFARGGPGLPSRVVLAFMLGGKFVALAAAAWALIALARLPAVHLAIGYSALVIGLLVGAPLAAAIDEAVETPGGDGGGGDA